MSTFANDVSVTVSAARNIQAGETYGYVTHEGRMASLVKIMHVTDKGIAQCYSGSAGGMGPFLMTFDAETGEGVGNYARTRLVVMRPCR